MKNTRFAAALAAALTFSMLGGCAVTRGQETVGAYVDDATITTRVKAKYAADPAVSAMAISVETLNGVVQLSGFAKTAAEKAQAEAMARDISGVKSVRNDIIIRPAQ